MVSKRGIDVLVRKDGSAVTSSENTEQRPQNASIYLQQRSWNQAPLQQGVYVDSSLPIESSDMGNKGQSQNSNQDDTEEQKEKARHKRAMERDTHRSNLKCAEQYQKQRMREIHEEIHSRENTYIYIRVNGNGNGLYQRIVFSARILNLQCFRYQGSTEVLWQVTLIEENGGKKVISPLYLSDDLKTLSKLKKTILLIYDKSDSTKSRLFLWEWLRRKLISMLDKTEIVDIPSVPGWYRNVNVCHFYTMADEDTTKFSTYMQKFNMFRYDGLGMGDILCLLVDYLEQAGDPRIAGMLLECRSWALFGGLTGQSCFRTGIVIYGKDAEAVVHSYLRTMINDVDTVNLDSDRMGTIRKNVCALQDTPVIYKVSDPGNRSVQNRLHEVLSWMQASCIEGESVKAPFVFCLKNFSGAIPLKDMLVLDASTIRLPHGNQILDKFQCLVIEMIEKSGCYWVDEIANRYEQYRESGICEANSMVKMIKEVLLKMFDVSEISRDLFNRFRKLLEAGEAEIEEQLSEKTGRLSEIFKEQVISLVDRGLFTIYDRNMVSASVKYDDIYFDTECYYFTEEALKKISGLAGIDKKSVLNIKRGLYDLSMVKTYRATGSRREELNIDFRIYNAYGQCKDLSGLAIKRELWDELGGIALCER